MKIYLIKENGLNNTLRYILTTSDDRLITHKKNDTEVLSYASIAKLLKATRTLGYVITNKNINEYFGVYVKQLVEFSSIWKVEEEYPEILI